MKILASAQHPEFWSPELSCQAEKLYIRKSNTESSPRPNNVVQAVLFIGGVS